mgnify:CR=1 FL=1
MLGLTKKQKKRIQKVKKGDRRSSFPMEDKVWCFYIEMWPVRNDGSGIWDFTDRVIADAMINSGDMYGALLKKHPSWRVNALGVIEGVFALRWNSNLDGEWDKIQATAEQRFAETEIPLMNVYDAKHSVSFDVLDIRMMGGVSPATPKDSAMSLTPYFKKMREGVFDCMVSGDWETAAYDLDRLAGYFGEDFEMESVRNTHGPISDSPRSAPVRIVPDKMIEDLYEWVDKSLETLLWFLDLGPKPNKVSE